MHVTVCVYIVPFSFAKLFRNRHAWSYNTHNVYYYTYRHTCIFARMQSYTNKYRHIHACMAACRQMYPSTHPSLHLSIHAFNHPSFHATFHACPQKDTLQVHMLTYIHAYIHTYVSMCGCVCVGVCRCRCRCLCSLRSLDLVSFSHAMAGLLCNGFLHSLGVYIIGSMSGVCMAGSCFCLARFGLGTRGQSAYTRTHVNNIRDTAAGLCSQ